MQTETFLPLFNFLPLAALDQLAAMSVYTAASPVMDHTPYLLTHLAWRIYCLPATG